MSYQAILPRDYSTLTGSVNYITEAADLTPIQDMITLAANGAWGRNMFGGATPKGLEIDASATGTFDLPIWVPVLIDNQSNRISGFSTTNGGTLKVQTRWLLYVSNAAITVTPVVYDITAGSNATISGAVACSATSDDYSGTNQQQTVSLTLPNAAHSFRPRVTIGGTVAAGYTVRAACVFDVYVDV